MRSITLIVLIYSTLWASAQLVEVPIAPAYSSSKKAKATTARVQALNPMPLPFWDDFSFRQTQDFPNDTLWESRQSVWVNHGRAINPPSIYTATFDGIDSTGRPYSVTDLQAKGFADRLVSRAINLGNLTAAQEEKVYLSFFYQTTGLSESPDRDDNLSLWFKGKTGNWEKVYEVRNSITLRTDSFYYAMVKVDTSFQHGNFQFRFQNFGRLSGPYDSWNLDYVCLTDQRDQSINYFPDRTIVNPITSIFTRYRAIPIIHYKDTATHITISPIGSFGNLLINRPPQTSTYYAWNNIITKKNEIISEKYFFLDSAKIENDLPAGLVTDVTLKKTVPIDSIDLTSDSVAIRFILSFKSGDEDVLSGISEIFTPIDFFLNDTTATDFILKDYYAYDDGTAEYGAGLNRAGANLAYWFPMFTKDTATVVAVKLHFPQFGDAQNRTLVLKLWSASEDGKPQTELTQQTITVQRKAFNEFVTVPLDPVVDVQGSFFIGWQQTTNTLVPVGLDKNTDTGNDIYFNIAGNWEQNQNVSGSLMIRPVFGEGSSGGTTGLEPKAAFKPYPNPSSGKFSLPAKIDDIQVVSSLGVNQEFQIESTESRTNITMHAPANGLYLVRWRYRGNLYTSRVLLRLD